MNLADLERKLISAARRQPPSDRVPYAFAQRITALVRNRPAPDYATLWARALWRGAAACFAITVLMGAISFLSPQSDTSTAATDLSQDFENTMLATVNQESDTP